MTETDTKREHVMVLLPDSVQYTLARALDVYEEYLRNKGGITAEEREAILENMRLIEKVCLPDHMWSIDGGPRS